MSNKKNTPKKYVFGRNLFTLLVILPIVIIVVLGIFITINYISAYNSAKISPFIDKTSSEKFPEGTYETNGVKTLKENEFNDFGVIFKCTNYNEDAKTATYELRTYENDNTPKLTGEITANICLTANWINFVTYGSKSSTIKMAQNKEKAEESAVYRKTFTVKDLVDLPAKSKTWPVKITVSEPLIYLYLSYTYQENGKSKTEAVILKYTYSDLQPETGGIRK